MKEQNTLTSMVMADGSVVEMTLNYARLYKLRSVERLSDLYARFTDIQLNGFTDELDPVTTLYVGYLCANIDDIDECMTEEEFYATAQENRSVIMDAWKRLLYPKELTASAKRS